MDKVKTYKKGANVTWPWLGRSIQGKVVDVFFKPVTKQIKGKSIKRNGSKENPAYLVESDAGNLALKLHSELTKAEPKKVSRSPKMFG